MKINTENIVPVDSRPGGVIHRYIITTYEGAEELGDFTLSESRNHAVPTLGVIEKATTGARFKVGDKVFFRRYGLDELNYDSLSETKLFLLEEPEIVAILEGGEVESARVGDYSKIEELKNANSEKASISEGKKASSEKARI
jgi:hypothetical protein